MSEETNTSVLFKKGDNSTNSQDDVWDDTVLIRAYEKSVKAIRKKINSGLVISDEKKNFKVEEELEESEIDELRDDWKVLDLCTAVYSEDGLIYPATIQEIYDDNENESSDKKCRIQYLDYLNEEEKYLSELMEYNEADYLETQEEEFVVNDLKKIQKNEKKFEKATGEFSGLAIPPPPPPPILNLPGLNEDPLYSMLLSWYMSGYQTGYYFAKNQK